MKAKIYHNPRCSKSRATLALLAERGIDPEIIEYLTTPPSATDIHRLLRQLNLQAAELIRPQESAFAESGLSLESPEDELIALMATEPSVIERPIVVAGNRARIGRPPENVLDLFS